ncbi:hexapeptide transferase [Chryseobacterium sp. Leaf180]|uniref:acetyltransferase n=1 Tax=Chryseobacterium sp. Leaf180 TaxID=1736289 RepID=UPI0006FF53F5|nr:acetyltransferase [Chryseobacterium sp. Leaf180]KQR91851.1 hexapeptide transferase [Chryseobacterium sp. Leaf180]
MIIVGAKGFAKEVLEILHQNGQLENLAFYDDVTLDCPNFLFNTFPILKSEQKAVHHFEKFDNTFIIGLGGSILRKKMYDRFTRLGGTMISAVSKFSDVGSYDVAIGSGSAILSGAIVSNSVTIGKATIVYYNSIITHDVTVGDFVEISPGAKLLGRCTIGDFSTVGTNAVIFPDVKIGTNVIVGAGAVVNKDLPDNCVAVGVPAKIIN